MNFLLKEDIYCTFQFIYLCDNKNAKCHIYEKNKNIKKCYAKLMRKTIEKRRHMFKEIKKKRPK